MRFLYSPSKDNNTHRKKQSVIFTLLWTYKFHFGLFLNTCHVGIHSPWKKLVLDGEFLLFNSQEKLKT